MNVCSIVIFTSLVIIASSDESEKRAPALEISSETMTAFFSMYLGCVDSSMPSMKYGTDDLKSFVNYPSKTTVGVAPKFTSNRKFFANMISTPEFKNMLAKDEQKLKQDLIKKMKYCDTVVMDQNLLQAMYDREVDQTKI